MKPFPLFALDYSKHAQQRLVLRRVTKRQVIAAMRYPDGLYEDVLESTFVAVKRTKSRYLVVVYAITEAKRKRVVTVYHASNIDGLIRRNVKRGIWRKTD